MTVLGSSQIMTLGEVDEVVNLCVGEFQGSWFAGFEEWQADAAVGREFAHRLFRGSHALGGFWPVSAATSFH